MEKYNKYIDPMTGINPFLQPKRKKITIGTIFKAYLTLFLCLLYKANILSIKYFIKIKHTEKKPKKDHHVIISNSVTQFDKDILEYLYGTSNIIFPENTNTNGKGVLTYHGKFINATNVILRYNTECVWMYGSFWEYLKFWVIFLGNARTVDVFEVDDVQNNSILKRVKFTAKDKREFMEQFGKK